MASWIMLLRAVNVGNRRYPMARVRETLTAAGFTDVSTHIQTGNIALTTSSTAQGWVEEAVGTALTKDIGFHVEAIALTPAALAELAADTAELSARHRPEVGHFVSVLRAPATSNAADALHGLRREGEVLVVRGRAVHLLLDRPFREAKTTGPVIERLAGLATTRNARVIAALAANWAPPTP